MPPSSPRSARRLAALTTLAALSASGCQSFGSLEGLLPGPLFRSEPEVFVEAVVEEVPISPEIYRRADRERADRLEAEVERLRADLRQAEEVMVSIESGLRGSHSRAEAVSSLAEARIRVERAARETPWRASEIKEARSKLGDAEAQIEQGNFGAAVFFVYSARRIAGNLEKEAQLLAKTPAARFVRGARVNLRGGPSTDDAVIKVLSRGTPVFEEGSEQQWTLVRTTHGRIGWVHSSLLQRPQRR